MIVLAAIPLLIWLYLLIGHAQFWRVSKRLAPRNLPKFAARVIAVIPARDEAGTITRTVQSLLLQTAAVIVVDDNSSDATSELARAAGATVVEGKPLASGWTGKLWALSQGVAAAEELNPDFLLLTDADITHHPNSVAQLTGIAESGGYGLVSFMVKLHCETLVEKFLIPAFVFFFFKVYPPGRKAGAAGGCVLVRPQTLRAAGGLHGIRAEVIDDCALASSVARAGGRIWLGLTPATYSTRVYKTFADAGRMISRTAFSQLQHSALLLTVTVLGLFVTYLLPPLLLLTRNPVLAGFGAAAWLLMLMAYLPIVRFYGLSPLWGLTLPATATFYLGATVHSAIRYWTGRGGSWKGRVQDAKPSRGSR